MISSSTGIPPKPMKEAYSIGIIGGADGPTAVFVTGRFPWEIVLIVLLAVCAGIWFIRRKK